MIKFYNTLTKKKEIFKPIKPGTVLMYNCGPTVYWYAHIGNFRSYLFADILRRFLEYKEFKVKQVMNITDVGHMVEDVDIGEDKIELAAKKEGKTPQEIAEFYTKAFLEDWKTLNLEEPIARPRATENIKGMIEMIKTLIEKGYAYVVNGSVYFNIAKFKNYGKLSHNTIEQLRAGAGGRVEENPDKKDQLDFALWIHDPKHLMQWDSPWDKGYPGWHIECSVLADKFLAPTIDIKTGGEDNIFPHHECEIAQSEAAKGVSYANYYMHVRHLIVEGKKMSKSLGNFYTLRDLLEKGHSPKAIRYILLSAHYRTNLNLTEESLKDAEKTVNSLIDFLDRIKEIKAEGIYNKDLGEKIKKTKEKFDESLSDDMNMPLALAAIFDLVRETNKAIERRNISKENLEELYEAFMSFDKVLGILEHEKEEIPKDVKELIEEREQARKNKDFEIADKIRKELKKKGYIVEDTPSGPRCRKL